MIHQRKGTSN